uniref:Uncharacterized protein n=1 Tax=Romanomermis culicivorax TaxID=13658 RepID=A0A915KM02_ROMCU
MMKKMMKMKRKIGTDEEKNRQTSLFRILVAACRASLFKRKCTVGTAWCHRGLIKGLFPATIYSCPNGQKKKMKCGEKQVCVELIPNKAVCQAKPSSTTVRM